MSLLTSYAHKTVKQLGCCFISGFGNKPGSRTHSEWVSECECSEFDKSGNSCSMCNNSADYVSINLETPWEKECLKIHTFICLLKHNLQCGLEGHNGRFGQAATRVPCCRTSFSSQTCSGQLPDLKLHRLIRARGYNSLSWCSDRLHVDKSKLGVNFMNPWISISCSKPCLMIMKLEHITPLSFCREQIICK